MKIRSKSLVDLMTQTDYFFRDHHEFDEKDVEIDEKEIDLPPFK